MGRSIAWVGLGGSLNPERPGGGGEGGGDQLQFPVGSRGTAEEVVINSEQNIQTQSIEIAFLLCSEPPPQKKTPTTHTQPTNLCES